MSNKFLKQLRRYLLPGLSLAFLYFVGSQFYFRLDLTADQRYSLHTATKKLLSELDEVLHIDIYLTGELPTDLKQLKRATQELLEECKVHAGHPIRYRFVDLDKATKEEKKNHYKQLASQGIQPTNLYLQEKGQRIEKLIFPGALLTYKGRTGGMLLLKGNKMTSPAQMVNQSIEGLEYEFAQTINQLVRTKRKQIAVLRGHQEPDLKYLNGLLNALAAHYRVQTPKLSAKTDLSGYDALLITRPQRPFSESEKYVLDQYIMQGGKVLFFLDRLRTNMENLHRQVDFAFPLELGLEDQLFKYGVRINPDLVQDLRSGAYPVVVGNLGNQPQIQLLPWPFFPILNLFADHLVTKNMDALYPQFVSSIDKIQVPDVTHTPLVFTSQYARRTAAPVQVDLETLRKAPQPAHYNHGHLPLAYLLEGRFTSLYKNRFLPEGFDETHFLPDSRPTKLLVVASGSLVRNSIDARKKQLLPWGYDPFLRQQFANKDFVLNALAYMLDEGGLIQLKQKNRAIRLLDNVKINKERLGWQLINLITPLLLLGMLGILWNYLYRRAYQK
ncbi:MAG: gliding motility-associated ABC transporter substrate-binding protein GldG [Bacteroidota bacterium]